jgi:hypothetical protein
VMDGRRMGYPGLGGQATQADRARTLRRDGLDRRCDEGAAQIAVVIATIPTIPTIRTLPFRPNDHPPTIVQCCH